jgi:PKD repeat protein
VSDGPSTVCPSSKYTDSIKIQVDPASVGGTTAGADTVCQGSNSGIITLSGHVGTVQGWEYSTNNGTSWTAIPNTTATLSYTGLTTLPNTITQYQYRARVRSGVCSEVYSSITTITVLPPVTKAEVENRSECNVTNSLLTGNTALQGIGTWTQLPGGPSVALISDIHNPTSSVSNLVVGVYTFKWTIDNGYCAPSSATMTLTNYPAIVNEIQTAVDTICADQAILIGDKIHSGGTGTYKYTWQSSLDGTNWTIIPAQTGLTLAMNLSTSTYFRRIISSAPCSSVSDSIYIFVQPALANNTITAISEVCINKPVAIIIGSNPTGGDGNFSYQWQSKVGAGAWTNIVGATGKDYQPQPLLQTTSFRRIVTTALCNGPQQSVSVANEIIVRLNAKAEFSASKLVNCSPFNLGSVITLTPYPDLNSTYKWYADGVLIGTGTTFPAYTIANDGVTVAIKLVTLSKFGCDSAEKVISFQTIKHVTAAFTKSVALGCGPLTVNFNNTSTPVGPGPQYQWNFGNGQTSTLANPPAITFQPHPLNRDTTYVIRLRAYTDCQESIFIDSVLVRPKPVSIFSPDKTEGCAPVVVNFSNQSKGHPATYKFIFGDGNTYTTTTLETVQHVYQDVLVNTLYTAKLIVTNECGVDSSSYVIKVKPNTVVANLVVNGPEKQGCPPHTVTFFNNSTGANQFIWNFGDGTPIITNTARTMVHTFAAGGTYQVKLTATNGCSVRETTETIVVYPEPISSFTTVKNTYCKDEWINFVNTSPQGDFVWTFGDGVSSTQTNPQHRFVTPGTYVVTLTTFVTQPDGTRCSKSVSQSYTVLNPPIATFSSNASAFNCAPFHLIVSNTSQFANKYSWYVDGVLVSTQATPLNLWLYASNKSVTVRLVAENTAGCASTSVEQTIQMYPRPEANFLVLPSQIIKIPNYTFRFQNTTSGAVTSYKWSFGDGNTSTEVNPSHTYKLIGQYQVSLIAFNQEGCSDTLTRQVEVQTVPGYLYVPNAFEPASQTYELKTFKPKGSGIESYHLRIFNKWGFLIWESTMLDSDGSPLEGWDGLMNGLPAPPDVYVWTIDAKFINQTVWPGMRYKSSDKPKAVGSIHLIR